MTREEKNYKKEKPKEIYQMKKLGKLMVVIDEHGYRELYLNWVRVNDRRNYKKRV